MNVQIGGSISFDRFALHKACNNPTCSYRPKAFSFVVTCESHKRLDKFKTVYYLNSVFQFGIVYVI